MIDYINDIIYIKNSRLYFDNSLKVIKQGHLKHFTVIKAYVL